jgi:hypothetical protein
MNLNSVFIGLEPNKPVRNLPRLSVFHQRLRGKRECARDPSSTNIAFPIIDPVRMFLASRTWPGIQQQAQHLAHRLGRWADSFQPSSTC